MSVCLLLALATLAVYAQTLGHGFVFYDDDVYVYENSMVQTGLSAKGLVWAFTTFHAANWHPLTWISYMVDYQLFGLNAGVEHAVNLALHLGATLLLFLAFVRMTRQPWRCALLAGMFALHPLRVESVAWVAERKDVLSAFFQMLTLLLYARYTEEPKPRRYAVMALAFAMSLLAKSMAVTLPLVLLLLDVWPLRRFDVGRRLNVKRLLLEKAPLFAMSTAASVLTLMAGRQSGAMDSLTHMSFAVRLANAVLAYLGYIQKVLWPVDLAVLYPLRQPSPNAVVAAALILAATTISAVLVFRRRPYFLVGWLWYLGMLVPVIGLTQIGVQSMADRFTYVPVVGLSVALIWSVGEAVDSRPWVREWAAALAILALVALTAVAYRQTGYWRNSRTLFEHTLAVTSGNSVIQNNLGVVLQREGRREEAEALYRQALATNPSDAGTLNNLGVVLADEGRTEEAVALFGTALAADRNYVDAHINLGHELLRLGRFDEAFPHLSEGLRLKPRSAPCQVDMEVLLAAKGNFDEARRPLEEAVRLESTNAQAQNDLCFVLQHLSRLDPAIAACNAALGIKPDFLDARFNLGNALAAKGRTGEAAAELARVLAANPNHAPARAALGEMQRVRQ